MSVSLTLVFRNIWSDNLILAFKSDAVKTERGVRLTVILFFFRTLAFFLRMMASIADDGNVHVNVANLAIN